MNGFITCYSAYIVVRLIIFGYIFASFFCHHLNLKFDNQRLRVSRRILVLNESCTYEIFIHVYGSV